jgi:excisionase family DNA binding protein
MPTDTEYLTTAQVARHFNRSRAAVTLWLRKGQLRGHKFGPAWMVARSDVDAFTPPPIGYPKGRPRRLEQN